MKNVDIKSVLEGIDSGRMSMNQETHQNGQSRYRLRLTQDTPGVFLSKEGVYKICYAALRPVAEKIIQLRFGSIEELMKIDIGSLPAQIPSSYDGKPTQIPELYHEKIQIRTLQDQIRNGKDIRVVFCDSSNAFGLNPDHQVRDIIESPFIWAVGYFASLGGKNYRTNPLTAHARVNKVIKTTSQKFAKRFVRI